MSLRLPKTGLVVRDGTLTKIGKEDAVLAELPLADVTDVRVERTAQYGLPLVIIGVLVSLAVVCKLYVPVAGLAWTGAIICFGIAAFAVLLIHGRKIVIQTRNGVVGYAIADEDEEADGFLVSLRYKLESQGAKLRPPEAS